MWIMLVFEISKNKKSFKILVDAMIFEQYL